MRRRDFLAAAAAGFVLPRHVAIRPFRRRSDDVRVAVAGVRSQGMYHVRTLQALPGVDVVALVDVDEHVLSDRLMELAALKARGGDHAGDPPVGVKDLRSVLDRDDIHAVSLATPNHLHSMQAIWACDAGKDVYVEKPVSHNVFEGEALVMKALSTGRVVQAGTQSRSSSGIAEGIAWMAAGNLGAIKYAHSTCYKPRQSIGKVDGPQPVPAHIDWDLWCGPAPLEPLHRKRVHYDWHWQFVTGNGDLGNQGIHQMDTARWALGQDDLGHRARSFGGRYGYEDDGDTPNTQCILLESDGPPILFEVRGLPRDKAAQADGWNHKMDAHEGYPIATSIHCEEGVLVIPNTNHEAIARSPDGEVLEHFKGASNHHANFIEAVRAGDPGLLNAPIEEGHLSSALCHLGNISYQLGLGVTPDDFIRRLGDDEWPAESAYRFVDHLMANEVDLEGPQITLGRVLEYTSMRSSLPTGAGDSDATALLTRAYRPPYVVHASQAQSARPR